jgi:sirohydrochlorin cobaltochelatase
MDALIIVAHGSRLKSSNDEIVNIANNIKANYDENEMLVLHAFLELTDPSIYHTLNKAVSHGCKKIKIFPYFLAAGKHVKDDIPSEIKQFKKRYPEVEFILLPHIGQCKGIEDLIISNV